MAVTLQEAIVAAQHRCSGDEWLLMSPAEQTRVIYREMRRLDQEQATARKSTGRATDVASPRRGKETAGYPATAADPRVILCRAPVRTRSSGLCAWKATVIVNGVPYCGFHARLEETQRSRVCAAVEAD
jgi:hypothetical protein